MDEQITAENRRRIALTLTAAQDVADIPKVEGAGGIEVRDGAAVQVMHNGVLVEHGGYHGAWMAEIIRRLRGHHEPQEERAFHALVRRLAREAPGRPTMIELGGFWSYYSLWFAAELDGARNVIIEPDPSNLALARRNLALNGREATLEQAAVGIEDGAPVRIVCESDGEEREVPAASVDGLARRHGLERVDLLLADVQGAELDALRSASELARSRRLRFLVISTHHHRISGDPLVHERCLALLEEWGAHVIVEHAVEESVSGDGLIVASLDPRDADLVVEVHRAPVRQSLFGPLGPDLAEAQAAARDATAAAAAAGQDAEDARRRARAADDALRAASGRLEELEAELERVRVDREALHAELHAVLEDRERLHRELAGRAAPRRSLRRR